MWSYYGSKSKIVDKYPHPTKDVIVEPFAGSARYSLKHWEKDVVLLDKFDKIIRLWKYLQNSSPSDILGLPRLEGGDCLDDIESLSDEERMLLGFIINPGSSVPKKSVSKKFGNGKMGDRIERDKKNISSNLHKIKHWKFIHGDYHSLANIDATWYIDPPYQHGGQWYKTSVSNKHIDFVELAEWNKSRRGQVIVCENSKADWMDFKFLSEMNGSKYKTKEVIWYRDA